MEKPVVPQGPSTREQVKDFFGQLPENIKALTKKIKAMSAQKSKELFDALNYGDSAHKPTTPPKEGFIANLQKHFETIKNKWKKAQKKAENIGKDIGNAASKHQRPHH